MTPSKRLIKQFAPKHYRLELSADVDNDEFDGKVQINGILQAASNSVILHSKNITIKSASINGQPAKNTYDKEEQELTLSVDDELPSNQDTIIEIEYAGKVGHSNTGLYLSSYKENGKDKKILATQLESIYARKVLPCIDDPEAKATFQVTVTANSSMTVVSNTLAEKVVELKDKTRTTFKKTPVMSSYLLAIIVGQMDFVETKTKSGVIIRTYAIPSDIHNGETSLAIAKDVIEFYDDYFGLPYPLENLNQIAMPDVEAGVGAMENWGCIVYRSDSLLVDPVMTSLPARQYIAIVIAHEIAHQWFGNLVTMAWWDDLWLNEGFATWIEYEVSTKLFPEWNLWSDFLSGDYVAAMQLDSRTQSHPIVAKIDNVKQIPGAFDAITYRKGASVIRMLQSYLGPEDFRKGVRAYMKQFQYANAQTDDLWAALSKASGKDVKQFMHSWTDIEGHPIVTINGNTISQERFTYNPNTGNDCEDTWLIPIKSTAGLDITLDQKTIELDDKIDTNAAFNAGQAGFYRIKYDAQMINYFKNNYNDIAEEDRIGFFFEIFDQTEAGYLSLGQTLPLLNLLKDEQSSHVWDSALNGLGAIHNVFLNDQTRDYFGKQNLPWVLPKLKDLGFDENKEEEPSKTLIRPLVIGLAAAYKHKPTVDKLMDLFDQIIEKGFEAAPTDYRGTVYSTAARNGDQETFDKLVKLYKNTTHSEEQRRIAGGICSFKQSELGEQARELIIDGTVKVQDAYVWIIRQHSNRHQSVATWKWVETNWAWVDKHYGSAIMFADILRRFADQIKDPDTKDQIIGFIKNLDKPQYSRTVRQMEDIAEVNIEWVKRDSKLFQ